MSEFFSMGDYGFYIWSSFGMTLLILVCEVIWLSRRHKALLQRLQRMARLDSGAGS